MRDRELSIDCPNCKLSRLSFDDGDPSVDQAAAFYCPQCGDAWSIPAGGVAPSWSRAIRCECNAAEDCDRCAGVGFYPIGATDCRACDAGEPHDFCEPATSIDVADFRAGVGSYRLGAIADQVDDGDPSHDAADAITIRHAISPADARLILAAVSGNESLADHLSALRDFGFPTDRILAAVRVLQGLDE